MVVVKNINNNVSLCLDSRGKEVVVFGKGVGFIKPPTEVPLKRIERTFYDINQQYLSLLNDIPFEVIEFTARQFANIQDSLPYETNANLILVLADHLAFAMERAKKGIFIQMPSIYDLEQNYPLEIKLGRQIVAAMEQEFKVRLPKGEIQGVAMHFINAQSGYLDKPTLNIEEQYEEILERTTQIIEHETGIQVRRDTFNYARFATHVQYLLKRIFEKNTIDSTNIRMYESIKDEYPVITDCV
jgi:beta-glucoside operon transcriptional antiterminator